MNRNNKSVIGYFISFAIAVILLYLVFSSISLEEFMKQAEKADYSYVLLSIGITIIAHIARGYRWNLLIRPTGFTTTTYRTTGAVLVGYIVNLVLPRLGEITRCGVLKKTDKIPITITIGTVISERIIDVCTLALITLLALLFEYDKLTSFFYGLLPHIDSRKLIFLALFGVIALGAVTIAGLAIYRRLKGRFRVILDQLFQGLFSLRKLDNIPAFILSTIVIWVTYFLMGYFVFFAVKQTSILGWQAALMLLVSGSVAMTLPVQGGFGTFHTIVSSMLLLYAVDKTTGVFFATLVHSSQVAATVIFGVVGLVMTLFFKELPSEKQQEK